jgi:hypothetical protein
VGGAAQATSSSSSGRGDSDSATSDGPGGTTRDSLYDMTDRLSA